MLGVKARTTAPGKGRLSEPWPYVCVRDRHSTRKSLSVTEEEGDGNRAGGLGIRDAVRLGRLGLVNMVRNLRAARCHRDL